MKPEISQMFLKRNGKTLKNILLTFSGWSAVGPPWVREHLSVSDDADADLVGGALEPDDGRHDDRVKIRVAGGLNLKTFNFTLLLF